MAANFIRLGVVSAVDFAHEDGPRAKMQLGGLETDWLPWTVQRAGGTRTESAPTVGEQRVVFSPYGDLGQGVIGPAIHQDDYPTPATSEAQDVAVFADGTRVEYDSDANKLQIDVAGAGLVVINCQQATVSAAGGVTLDTPDTHCTGNLTVDGNAAFNGGSVTHGGTNIGKSHTHGGVQTGSGTTGAPT